jgi:hypothetical protein
VIVLDEQNSVRGSSETAAHRSELKHLTTPRAVAPGMSDATKVVLGTVAVAGLLGVAIVLSMAL